MVTERAPSPPALVIFDCDGVLVDSERIAVEIDLLILGRVGLTMSKQDVVDRFLGRSVSVMDAAIEEHLGHPLSSELRNEFAQLYADAFERDLIPVPGIEGALAGLAHPRCVASSSTPESLRRKLTHVGLWEEFEGRVFSAVEVANGKPAPDLFLHAAEQMRTAPERCVVVEDSRYGVQAARAAGMHVFAFVSELVDPDSLRGPGTTVFADMTELPGLVDARLAG